MRISGRNVAIVSLAVFMIALVAFTIIRQASANDRLRSNYDALHEQYVELYGEAQAAGATPATLEPDEVSKSRVGAGEILIPVPEPLPSPSVVARPERGATGPQGDPGPPGPGPTEAQVRAAVREYCDQDELCNPTEAQVEAAVDAYCADDACAGSEGEDGTPGEDGQPGADATDAQVDAAVARYCAAQPGGSCVGADGEDGSDGARGERGDPGPPGRDGKDGKTFPPIDQRCSKGMVAVGLKIDSPSGTTTLYCEPMNSVWFAPLP